MVVGIKQTIRAAAQHTHPDITLVEVLKLKYIVSLLTANATLSMRYLNLSVQTTVHLFTARAT